MNTATATLSRDKEGMTSYEMVTVEYPELKSLAAAKLSREQHSGSLDATALVHDAYLRLKSSSRWENRRHFFAAASESMRRILIDRARSRNRLKRGEGKPLEEFSESNFTATTEDGGEFALVTEALEKLSVADATAAKLVKLRYFAGLTFEEAAKVLGISIWSAKRQWTFARTWLRVEIGNQINH